MTFDDDSSRVFRKSPSHDDETVKSFTSEDIILGKGNGINCLPGNVKFRNIISAYKPLYQQSPRHVKHKVAERVLQEIVALGGRFLEQQPDKSFLVVSKRRQMEKTCQALREKKKSSGKGGVVHAFTKSVLHPQLQSIDNKSPTELQVLAHMSVNSYKEGIEAVGSSSNMTQPRNTVTSNDVLYGGRGPKFFHHPANQRFQDYVKQFRHIYWNTHTSKKNVASKIIRTWRQQTPPGRFLELRAGTGENNDEFLYEMPEERVLEKVCQSLRDLKRGEPLKQEKKPKTLPPRMWPPPTTSMRTTPLNNSAAPPVVCAPVWISPSSSAESLVSPTTSHGGHHLFPMFQQRDVETAAILTMLGMRR